MSGTPTDRTEMPGALLAPARSTQHHKAAINVPDSAVIPRLGMPAAMICDNLRCDLKAHKGAQQGVQITKPSTAPQGHLKDFARL
jgi:hypothetical protein